MTCPRCHRADCPSTIDLRKTGTCRPAARPAQPSTLLYAGIGWALRAAALAILPLLPAAVVVTAADLIRKRHGATP